LVSKLFEFIETNAVAEDVLRQSSAKVILLVLLSDPRFIISLESTARALLLHATQLFIGSLRESNLFLQDISCLGLIRCYALSPSANCSGEIADEVGSALMKERRKAQPAGYAEAGQTLASPSPIVGNAEPAPAGTADAGNPLAAAQERLAAELGIAFEAMTSSRGAAEEGDSDKFGVYSIVMKIIKKTGDSSLLFRVLGLIQRDPNFAVGDASEYYTKYAERVEPLTEHQLRTLIPAMYLHRYDPNVQVRDVMQKLWASLVPKDTAKALVDSLQHDIIARLAVNVTSKSWRYREAACIALEGLLFSREWEVIFRHLTALWESGIKVSSSIVCAVASHLLNKGLQTYCRCWMIFAIVLERLLWAA
jgi:hypothetical protein